MVSADLSAMLCTEADFFPVKAFTLVNRQTGTDLHIFCGLFFPGVAPKALELQVPKRLIQVSFGAVTAPAARNDCPQIQTGMTGNIVARFSDFMSFAFESL